ncbi:MULTISPECIES: potassium-transporting ATPase subunit KdpC [Mesorhizobium]|uniref:Potassium-transporting ATPase KdpC subunit n=1 Tax=Mesorhizobium denitrificans TaxID=2294114 RepID=A0A371XIC2_9HYPH|nr:MULTISPECIES: potassium-transporting ATPase subunit KdpC [Mesorhizobium]RFC68963.1 potassium-transporting ATPase subunit KdpC [Mesorhizobium denitrificans]
MQTYLRPAIVLTLAFILLTGIAYPLAVTGVAQLAFPAQANGSLIRNGDVVIGSALIGQQFTADKYFWPRPSVAGTGYDAAASSGSNLGPTSAKLAARVKSDLERIQSAGAVPGDGATASGSGLDPHISPQFAALQITRVAKARGISESDVDAIVDRFTEGRLFGIVGEPRVNVLLLNMALDAHKTG